MTTLLTTLAPTPGPADGKRSEDPAVREAWLDFRRGGITATEIRDWLVPSEKRAIITAKVTGVFEDLSYITRIRHGNLREPVIAEWVEREFGIAPCENVYAHAENPRHLASPDGMTVDLFSLTPGGLIVGTPDAILSEIKTSVHDLTPGPMDERRVLLEVTPGSHFDKMRYYRQVNWQMYVMNAYETLFTWERHDGIVDRETGIYSPVGPPEFCRIPRDQALIDQMVEEANVALQEIDAARIAFAVGGLPPASELPSDHALLVADLLAARDAEAVAVARKAAPWKSLQAIYLAEGMPDQSIDAGFALLTVTTGKAGTKTTVDEAAARAELPEAFEALEAAETALAEARANVDLILRKHTTTEATPGTRKLTITAR